MITPLPTESDINIFDSLDGRHAVAQFLGKYLSEAQQMFCDNFLSYSEDLLFMGPRAMRFYLQAALGYLLSQDANNDSDAASSFCGVLEFRLDEILAGDAAFLQLLRRGILQILRDFDRFRCDMKIDGDVASRYAALLERLPSDGPPDRPENV